MSKFTLAGDFQFNGYKREGSVNLEDLGIETLKSAFEAAKLLAPEYLPVMGCWVLCRWLDNGVAELVGEFHGRILEGQKKVLYKVCDELKGKIE